MRISLLALSLFFAPLTVFGQHAIAWENELSVADGASFGNIRPRLTLVNDLPVVLIGKVGNGELYVVKGNGTGFNAPVGVVPSGMQTYLANWTGPDIASNGNNVVVVFKAQPIDDGNIYAVRSTDGGITFSDTIRVDNFDQGQTWMPALDMDENGNPHITYMLIDAGGGNERIAIASSTNGGNSYQPQQIVSSLTPGDACDCCPPELLIKGQYHLSLFRNNEANIRDIWGSLSEDGGATFNSTENLDNLGWMINSCPSTGPHGVISGDSVYVASASRANGTYRVYVSAVGLAGGLNLNSVQMMDEPTSFTGDTQNFPRISGNDDTLVVVWEEKELGNSDILCAVATDGNIQTLGAYKSKVNADLTGFQGKPDVVYKNGAVHVVYQDLTSGNVIYRKGTIVDVTEVNQLKAEVVEIYPNPSNQMFTISGLKMAEITAIEMFDLNGRSQSIELNWTSSKNLRIDCGTEIVPGIYLLEFKLTNERSFSKKVRIN